MMEVLPAHTLTWLVAGFGALTPPLMVFFLYRASGASMSKTLGLSGLAAVWGIALFMLCRYWQHDLDPTVLWTILFANLLIPPLLIVIFREFFVEDGLSEKWLLVPQAARYMGGLFLLENLRGHVGTAFAYPAGLGDIISAVIATTLLVQLLTGDRPNKYAYYFLVIVGALDFLSAYTFSCLSTDGIPFQQFALDEPHRVALFPLGMIPFYLAPFAMAYHALMFLSVRRTARVDD